MASCFVSYTGVDEPWAEWIATVLRTGGHDVTLQATDFLPGENFVVRMQEASAQAEHTIVVLSDRYLASGFATAEWAAAFATDPTGKRRALIPIAIEPVHPSGLLHAIIRIELFGKSEGEARELVLGAVEPKLHKVAAFPGGLVPAAAAPVAPKSVGLRAVEVWRLPTSDSVLIGRDHEVEQLSLAWSSGTNVVTIVGWGGSGKTSLLNSWLAGIAASRYGGAERVYAWSFDSQANGGQIATSDQFIDGALRFFGIEPMATTSVWERCRQLTNLLQQGRNLLILDGLDRLQEPPGGHPGGSLREPVMRMLVRELAAFNNGLCLITSRLPVADIQPFQGHTCLNITLGPLTVADGTRLLTEEGATGDTALLETAAAEARCHPLTLRLLGSYIRTVYHGDVGRWKSSGLPAALEQARHDIAGRIMDEYAGWFSGRPESQILSSIGLFDRPATAGELSAIRAKPAVDGLNNLLVDLNDVQWAYAVSNLTAAGLLSQRVDEEAALEAHPLVRSHFGAVLRDSWPAAWRDGHERLYRHLSGIAVAKPSNLKECLPLLSAVWHATQAGLASRMPQEIYWPRLSQDSHQLRDVLRAAATNFQVLSYIVGAADTAEPPLAPVELAKLLCDQALDLRMLGKPQDAVLPLRRAADEAIAAHDPAVATNALRHLAQLHLTLGQFAEAKSAATAATEQSVALSQSHVESVAAALTLADVNRHIGEAAAAYEAVREVLHRLDDEEVMSGHAHRATLYIAAFRAVEISVATRTRVLGDPAAFEDLVRLRDLVARLADLNQRTRALSLPRALMGLASAILAAAQGHLDPATPVRIDHAISEIRETGQRPWLVQGLLIQSAAFRLSGAFDSASSSLRDARAVCLADGMVTRQFDCDFEAATLEMARGNRWQARIMLDSLAAAAKAIGYRYMVDQATDAPGAPFDHGVPASGVDHHID